MDFRAALEYFRDRSDYDRGFISNPFAGDDAAAAGLLRTAHLLSALGSPERAYPIIHVAGTKGKGSTCAYIESVACRAGLTTGMFTTPHLHSIRERIRLDGHSITEDAWVEALERCAEAVTAIESKHRHLGRITAFELNTALALLAFRDAAVDLGIIEVGLGGRLDATNVVSPAVSVITPISYDHQAILGDTLEEIAREKAGIIKSETPVVVGPQEPAAHVEIVSRAETVNAPIFEAGTDWSVSNAGGLETLSGPWGEISHVELGLRGRHQAENAGAAVMALCLLNPELTEDGGMVTDGLRRMQWPGRYEIVHTAPTVIADGAHNGASMAVLTGTLLEDYADHQFVVIFGSYADKDLVAMLSKLERLDPSLIATRSTSPRALEPSAILEVAKSIGFDATDQPTVDRAIGLALDSTGPDTVIVATGSLSVVAEVREFFGLAVVSAEEREILSG